MKPVLALILLAGLASSASAADAPKKLTADQRARLKALVAAQPGGKLTATQREALRKRLAESSAVKPAAPAKYGSSAPAKPSAAATAAKLPSAAKPVADGAAARAVDAAIDAKLAAEHLTKSPAAADSEFLRRVTLDLTGVTPTADEARAYLADADPAKREKLVDRLLASPKFGAHLADLWIPKFMPRDSANRYVEAEPFRDWLAAEFNANRPWDQFVTNLITATGSPAENPATTLFLANRSADKLTDLVSTQFMGVQLACAQCHNHPFTDWKQDDYWGLAAFFAKVQPRPPGNPKRPDGAKPNPGSVTESPAKSRAKEFFPESAKQLPPKFPGGVAPALDAKGAYRPALAKWLTSGATPLFAEAFVNRAWAQLYGRGLVEPMDDLDPEHPASHPELFTNLATQFRATGFDVKRLYRTLALTETYARSSRPTAGNDADATLWSRMPVKVLAPEQLFDSIVQVVPALAGKPPAKSKLPGGFYRPATRDQFVQFFLAGSDAPNAKEYEAGIPQALRLMNSKILANPKVAAPYSDFSLDRACDKMYLATLARSPTDAERAQLRAYRAQVGGDAKATADILWALLNCSEFALNR